MTELFYGEVFRKLKENNDIPDYPLPHNKNLTAEEILIWLEEANQFTKQFLSKEALLKWHHIKNQSLKQSST